MSDAEVVARLLAAIDEIAHTGPSADRVMALCQSHRDIVAMYQEANAARGKTGPSPMPDLDHASAMGRLTTLGLVVQALARGYKEARDGD